MTSDRGHDYHKKKLISLVIGENPTWVNNAYLRAEAQYAGKFDDIIIEYFNERGQKERLCYQVKHTEKESRKINAADLLTQEEMITVQDMRNEGKKRYGLVKYFFSYQDLKRKGCSKYGTTKHVILYTNENFDIEDLTEKGIEIIGHFSKVDSTDLLLNKTKFKKGRHQTASARYRINRVPKLQEKCSVYHLIRVAKELAECVLKKTRITNDIFPNDNGVLAKKVIDVKTKKFRDEFVNGKNLSADIDKFRNIFSSEIENGSNGRIKLDEINDAIDRKKVGLNLCEEFGQGEDGSSTTISITEDNVEEFLKHLVFVVNQPNADELERILKEEMSTKLNRTTTEATFDNLCSKMTKLIQGKIDRLSINECRELYEKEIRLSVIRFDVKKPVATFTGRNEEVKKLHELFQSRDAASISPTVAISGLGGVGKTELARKCVDLHSQGYEGNVAWINAETSQTLSDSFLRLGKDMLGINSKNADGQSKDIKSFTAEVYKFFFKKKCLFIFDNAERLKARTESDSGIYDFLPNSLPLGANSPYVLITSRNQEWGERIESLPLTVFTKDEAVKLIKGALIEKDLNDELDMENLANKLQFFPLALQQAIAYINKYNKRYRKNRHAEFKVVNYLAEYETQSKKLLDFRFPDNCDDNYTKTTLITWNITIKKMKERKEYLALQILDIIAYFNSADIPTSTFLELISDEDKKEKLDDSIECLTQHSMVSWGTNSEVPTISIHRLVQKVIRIQLRENSINPNEKLTLKKALELFENGIDSHNVNHAEYVWDYASKHLDLVEEFADIPSKILGLLQGMDEPDRAASFGRRAGELLAKTIGLDDIRTAATFAFAAIAAKNCGRIGDACELFAKVNKKNASALCVLYNKGMAQLLENKSYDDFVDLQDVCCDFSMSANEPALFDERNNLSNFLASEGYKEAAVIILCKNLDDIREYYKSSGDSLKTALCEFATVSLMGAVLESLGKYKESLQSHIDLYERFKGVSSLQLPLQIRMHMATSMLYLGDYDGVLKIYHEVIEKIKLSQYKMRTSQFMYAAAQAFEASGDHNKSLEIAYEVFDIQTSLDGIPDLKILPRMSHIARLWHKLGENELAIQYYNQVIQRLKEIPSGLVTYNDILWTHLRIIDIKSKTKSREITLGALKCVSEETKNELGARNRWTVLLENYTDRWERGKDDDLDISREFSELTIFTDDMKLSYPQRTIASPLHYATINNQIHIVKWLVDLAGYNVNDRDDGGTPLHLAAFFGHWKIIDILLNKGAAVNAELYNGYTALSIAVAAGHLQVVEILLNSGANVNTKFKNLDSGTSADVDTKRRFQKIVAILTSTKRLFTIIKNNNFSESEKIEKFQRCINQGAILGATDNRDYGILDYAVHQKSAKIVEFLIRKAADVNRVTNGKGYTTLHIAVIKDCTEIVDYFLKHVSQDKLSRFINAQTTKDRSTALHVATQHNNTDIVRILVKNGADCDIKNARNEIAIDLAEPESEVRNILVSCRQK